MVVEDLLCDTQERNDNINKDDEFIVKNLNLTKWKDIHNELSNVRHTERKDGEPVRKIQNNKKNKRMTNLCNYLFESIVRVMTVGMNE